MTDQELRALAKEVALPYKQLISDAHEHGAATGQISLAEFVLASYGHELPETLKMLLNKVASDGYEVIGKFADKPAEDVALEVAHIVEKVVPMKQ